MTESHPFGPAGGSGSDPLASDVDPRFDPSASGTEPPRPETAARPAQEQWDEIVASCRSWVRDKPLQAVGIVAAVGFLLGRSGR